MYEESVGCEVTDASLLQLLHEKDIKVDDVTKCAMNEDGKPLKVHVATTFESKSLYMSDLFVGNPPQKLKGVFDTGSTNTWILNSNTKQKGDNKNPHSFHQDKSSSFKETKQTA